MTHDQAEQLVGGIKLGFNLSAEREERDCATDLLMILIATCAGIAKQCELDGHGDLFEETSDLVNRIGLLAHSYATDEGEE